MRRFEPTAAAARRWPRVLGTAAIAAAGGVAAYPVLLRDRCLTWGATREEVAEPLPGDDLLPAPDVLATRAVEIDAPAAAVWPWLVQMGSGRGGAYTYDWIENMFGLDMRSADRILPECQQLRVGDEIRLGPSRPSMRVELLEPQRVLSWRYEDGSWVWTFALRERRGRTRLVSRNRIAIPDGSPLTRLVSLYVMEPGSLVMERRMLLGIKRRAERAPCPVDDVAPA